MVRITDLNKRTDNREETVNANPNPDGRLTGPNPRPSNPFSPNMWQQSFKNNPPNEGFYMKDMFLDSEADFVEGRFNQLSQMGYSNFFPEGDRQFAQKFAVDYARSNIIQNKVSPTALQEITQEPAASANAIVDPNTAGKFPSNEVKV